MSLSSWITRLRNVFRADAVGDEIDREMAFHLAERAAALERSGMDATAARQEARRRFGNPGLQRETIREQDLSTWFESVLFDLRHAARGFRATPAFTAVVVLSLALGIGANTAIFSFVDVAMFRTLPVRAPEELVEITASGTGDGKSSSSFSQQTWEALRDRQDVLSGVFAYGSTGSGDLSTGGESRPIAVGLVTGRFFSVLGVAPAAGRLLDENDDVPGCAGVVVLTHPFWQREFGGDRSVVGRSIQVNGHPFTIAGVASPEFFGLGYGYYPPLWAPQCAGRIIRGSTYRGGGTVIGRLKPGVSIEEARLRIARLGPQILPGTIVPGSTAEEIRHQLAIKLGVESFARGFRFLDEDYGVAFLILMGIVGVILLIACVNSANLLLARATARQREMAVRLAIGAGRGRVIRQLLTESLLLSLVSAAVGGLFAAWGTSVLLDFMSRRGRPMLLDLTPDARVLGFTAAVTILTGVLFGLAPAWRLSRTDIQGAMRPAGRGVAEGHSRFGVGKGLVVAQIALSLVMVAGATLLVGSWRRLIAVDAGFDADGVTIVRLNARAAHLPDSALAPAYAAMLERLRALPGVASAAAADRTPMGNMSWDVDVQVPGVSSTVTAELNEVSEGYFATMRTPLVAGRDFNRGDSPGAPKVAIVSETFARQRLGGARAIGQHIKMIWSRTETTDYVVVGVVADTKNQSLDESVAAEAYIPFSQNPRPEEYLSFAIRAKSPGADLGRAARAAIMETDSRLSLTTNRLEDQVAESARLRRTLGLISGFFGLLALLLASIGLYGIMSYTVARRRNEIGVRMALGADRRRIAAMVLGDVGRIMTAGILVGIAGALASLRLAQAALFGVSANDPATLLLSALMLGAIGVAAAMAPALRAARVDPVEALRSD